MFAVPLVGHAALRKTLPLWLKWTSVVGFFATAFSLLISAYPFVTVVDARAYAAKILGTVVVSNCIAIGYHKMRRRTANRRQRDSVC